MCGTGVTIFLRGTCAQPRGRALVMCHVIIHWSHHGRTMTAPRRSTREDDKDASVCLVYFRVHLVCCRVRMWHFVCVFGHTWCILRVCMWHFVCIFGYTLCVLGYACGTLCVSEGTPGVFQGMLGTHEPVSKCLKAEFTEEALGTLMDDQELKSRIQTKLDELFSQGIEVKKKKTKKNKQTKIKYSNVTRNFPPKFCCRDPSVKVTTLRKSYSMVNLCQVDDQCGCTICRKCFVLFLRTHWFWYAELFPQILLQKSNFVSLILCSICPKWM